MNPEKLAKLKESETMRLRAESIFTLLDTITDPNHPGLRETPWRVAKMYDEMLDGYKHDPKQALRDAIFDDVNSKDLVLVKDIQFSSLCEHHLLPFYGTASIGYVPQDGRVVGLSKLARVVDIVSKRLQLQERIGKEIADVIEEVMNPRGIAVILKAEHTCMACRGVLKPGAVTITSCLRGSFFLDEKARMEITQMMLV